MGLDFGVHICGVLRGRIAPVARETLMPTQQPPGVRQGAEGLGYLQRDVRFDVHLLPKRAILWVAKQISKI